MSPCVFKRLGRLPALAALGLSGALLGGCHALHLPGEGPLPVDEPQKAAADASPSEAQDAPPAKDYPAALATGNWVLRVGAEKDAPPEPRWRHAELETLLALPADRRPLFDQWLNHSNPVVAGNAAIALARLGDGSSLTRLADTVRGPLSALPVKQRLAMRRAAAEALGAVEQPSPVQTLQDLLAIYGEDQSSEAPALRAELLTALGRHVSPEREPAFAAALRSSSVEVRLAAVEAWPKLGDEKLPEELVGLCGDGDPAVRRAALELLAARRHPEAIDRARQALRDGELSVRFAAIAALGRLGGDAAQKELAALLDDRVDRVRAAAVAALAQCQAWEAVIDAAGDDAWRVREAAARALAAIPTDAARDALARLLTDPSGQVTEAVAATLARWPLPLAGPLLVATLEAGSFETREAAAELLRERWPECPPFDPRATAERRAGQLAAVRQSWEESHPASTIQATFAVDSDDAAPDARRASTAPPTEVEDVENLVRQLRDAAGDPSRRAALETLEERLAALGPELVPALAALRQKRPLPEAIYHRVLPRAAPVFATLELLQSPQVEQRRRAAGKLRERPKEEPLGELALARLVEIVTPDRDALVWMDVQKALADDAREPVARLQVAGLSHPDAEVRRRACEYFVRHPHPRQEAMLLPSLDDENSTVATAALAALAEVEQLENPLPLVRLLASREKEVRLATATTLARLGYASGFDALERLSYDHEPGVRREAAAAMGRAKQRRFVPVLIRLLDDQLGVRRAALAALTEIAGKDIGQTGGARSVPEQVARWKSWYARGN